MIDEVNSWWKLGFFRNLQHMHEKNAHFRLGPRRWRLSIAAWRLTCSPTKIWQMLHGSKRNGTFHNCTTARFQETQSLTSLCFNEIHRSTQKCRGWIGQGQHLQVRPQHNASPQRYLKQVIWDLPNTMTGFASKDHHCCWKCHFHGSHWAKKNGSCPSEFGRDPNGFERMLAVLLRACVDSNLETDSENT